MQGSTTDAYWAPAAPPSTAIDSRPSQTPFRPFQPAALQAFAPISLSEMGDVALLRRTDTKYLMTEMQLWQALHRLTGHYRILEIDGGRLHRYQTLYFDTPDLALYRQHHNRSRDRYKVRERAYADSGLAFLEVKHKIDPHTTHKSRVRTAGLSLEIEPGYALFLHEHYPYAVFDLRPALLNTFRRITLVSMHDVERVTFDLAVQFWWNGASASLQGIAVAELKQNGFSSDSEFARQMHALGVRSTGFSKYCTGVSMLYPGVKRNRFKPRLLRIEKLMLGGNDVHWTH